MRYILSPEFHRNLWLDFTPLRIVAAPLVLALIAIGISRINVLSPNLVLASYREVFEWIYLLSVVVFGNYQAAKAFGAEIRDKTWDLQKMSSVTPGFLFFGKLFGATAYAWYVGLLALAVFTYGYLADATPPEGFGYRIFSLIAGGIFGQCVAFLTNYSRSAMTRTWGQKGGGGLIPFVAGIFVSYAICKALDYRNFALPATYGWYHMSLSFDVFIVSGILFFMGWAFVGIYRCARAELMYRVTPLYWTVFAVSVALYYGGFIRELAPFMACIFGVLAIFTYITMLAESSDIQKYRRLLFAVRQKDWRRSLESLPRWMATLPLTVLVALVTPFILLVAGVDPAGSFIFMFSILLFSLRDGFFIHACQLSTDSRRQRAFKLGLYFLSVYALLPFLHVALGGMTKMEWSWYYVALEHDAVVNLLAPAVEAVASFFWFRSKLVSVGAPR